MLRGVLGVIVGFVIWSMAWLGGNTGLQKLMPDALRENGRIDAPTALASLLVLSIGCSLIAGLSAGAIAKSARKKSAIVLGALLLAVGIGVQSSVWSQMPVWYHLVFLALLLPSTLVGAGLAGKGRP